MKYIKLINWLCLTGVLGAVFYLLHDIIGANHYPGYHWMSQAVSDLTALSSPSFMISRGLSTVYNLFACLSCVLVSIIVQDKLNRISRLAVYFFAIMSWVSGIGYSLFPLSESGFENTFTDNMHLVVTVAVVLLSIISLIMFIVGGFKKNGITILSIVALICFLCMIIGAVGVGLVPKEYFGLVERFGTYSAVIFNAILGWFGFKNFD